MNQQVKGNKKGKGKKHEADSGLEQQGGEQSGGADAGTGAAKGEASTKKGSNAPRARKWDYGIKPEARVTRLVEAANVKRDIQVQFTHTEGDPTVAEFMSRGGDRHGLRVMMRRKLIKLVHEDTGAEFPVSYVKPAAPEQPAATETASA